MNSRPLLYVLSAALMVACAADSTVKVSRAPQTPVPSEPVAGEPSASFDASAYPRSDNFPSVVIGGPSEQPQVYAADLLPPSYLIGPQFEIAPEVQLRGHMGSFKVRTDFGRLDADSVEIAEQRVDELAALARLADMSEVSVFGQAAAKSLRNTGRALKNVLTDPERTVRSIPGAVRSKVANTWDNLKLTGKEWGDRARAKMRGDHATSELNVFLPAPPIDPEKTWQQRSQEQGTKFGLDYLGYNSARRELTKGLSIDPYTSNPEIQDRLDSFAWSYLAGSKGTGLAVGALTGGASVVLSRAGQINRLVYDLPPEDLKMRNRNELKKIGVQSELARNFLRNSTFTPTAQTQLTDALTMMWEMEGLKELFGYLRYVDTELEARYMVNSVRMAFESQQRGRAIRSVVLVGVTPVFERKDGTVFVPAPVDYLHFDDKFRGFLSSPYFTNKRVDLAVGGKVSPRALAELESRGWQVQTHAQFENAPVYAN